MAFPDHLVQSVLDSFSPKESDTFFDPHCGSGTSLVEAQRYGLRSYGLDANPVSVLATKVKTTWPLDLSSGRRIVDRLDREIQTLCADRTDPIFAYLVHSGMVSRGWITEEIALMAIAIKRWIDRTVRQGPLYRFFLLSLINTVVKDLSNVRFGPELYCIPPPPEPPNVLGSFTSRVNHMLEDVEEWTEPRHFSRVRLGDSRDGRTMRTAVPWDNGPVYVITSPPYPTEHDYTRHSRLELVFMEAVADLQALRQIKRRMIRSHSKGIYVGDLDCRAVSSFSPVNQIVARISSRVRGCSSGFEAQYTKVISNYFGGMLRHLRLLERYLGPGSKLAYVVGDEASYKGVYVPTGRVLSAMVEAYLERLKVDDVILWRSRRSSKNGQQLDEHVLIMSVE